MRFRAEVALGRFDDALRTAKTMFAMSRHLGEHPTLIGNLVGIAIANIAIGPLEEMLEQPGCPNLYWALTNLPDPFISLEKGMDGERVIVLAEFRDLDDRRPMSADQLKTFIAHMDKVLGDEEPIKSAKGVRAWLDARTKDEAKVAAARRRLVESGLPEERLRRFPADQVILLDEKREYEVRRDDVMKTMTFPSGRPRRWTPGARRNGRRPCSPMPWCRPRRRSAGRKGGWTSGSPCCGTSRPCASTPRSTTASCPRSCPRSPCRCPTTRSPASRSATSRIGSTAHLRGTPPSGEEKDPPTTSITR